MNVKMAQKGGHAQAAQALLVWLCVCKWPTRMWGRTIRGIRGDGELPPQVAAGGGEVMAVTTTVLFIIINFVRFRVDTFRARRHRPLDSGYFV